MKAVSPKVPEYPMANSDNGSSYLSGLTRRIQIGKFAAWLTIALSLF